MRRAFFLVCAVLFLFSANDLPAFSSKGQDCHKCHSLKKEEAAAIMKNLDQNIKVMSVNPGPVKYLWEVGVDSQGKKGIIYVDLPKKHLFSGSLLTVQGQRNLTRERLAEIKKVNASQIPLKDALVVGLQSAKNKVIVFDDPD
ncbi:MAG: disulfide isomerase DsbC N-terminal domain-containing protein [Nitrospirota bacterium]